MTNNILRQSVMETERDDNPVDSRRDDGGGEEAGVAVTSTTLPPLRKSGGGAIRGVEFRSLFALDRLDPPLGNEKTLLLAFVPYDKSMDFEVPRIRHHSSANDSVFLGVVQQSRAGIVADSIIYWVNGVEATTVAKGGFLRPVETTTGTTTTAAAIRVGCRYGLSNFVEIAFMFTPA